MILPLLAATFTFTATATGVGKGTPVEFFFVGPGSDRDYEAMFVLDQTADEFCKGVEKAGIPRGKPVNARTCDLWPVGVPLTMKPAIADFVETKMPPELPLGSLIYTGGTRLEDGSRDATTNMPLAVFSTYTLPQSPLLFDGLYDQGAVYNCHFAKEIKKGTRVTFSLSWDEKSWTPPLSVAFRPGNSKEVLETVRTAAGQGPIEVLVDFDPDLTVREAVQIAKALSVIDSSRVKLNGCPSGHLYYQAFLPLDRWTDRQERLVQPFEYELFADGDRLTYIEEDWSVEGNDPKLTPKTIDVSDVKRYAQTETCFIYASSETRLSRIYEAMHRLKDSAVKNWYVFPRETRPD